jgi:hypothetical protein
MEDAGKSNSFLLQYKDTSKNISSLANRILEITTPNHGRSRPNLSQLLVSSFPVDLFRHCLIIDGGRWQRGVAHPYGGCQDAASKHQRMPTYDRSWFRSNSWLFSSKENTPCVNLASRYCLSFYCESNKSPIDRLSFPRKKFASIIQRQLCLHLQNSLDTYVCVN